MELTPEQLAEYELRATMAERERCSHAGLPMSAYSKITAEQPKIPEPWVPEHFLESNDNLPEVLEELAKQLGVMNDYYYPLLAAARQLRFAQSQSVK